MTFELTRSFGFEAAHWLPAAPEGHKCRRLHGHSFSVEIQLEGELHPDQGWVLDFADIDQAFAPLHERLDHRCLNEVDGLANPTSENVARWIWDRLESRLPGLLAVCVRETCNSAATYRGNRRPSGGSRAEEA
jgi:6-pyruvoyltetrahydropterin/6-carboxytetrahydropterin synthase